MGSVFRPKYKNKDGTVQESHVWWIKYYRDGSPHRESSGSEKVGVARDLLKEREGDSVKGIPITPKMGRVLFSELADAVLADYKMNKKKSLDDTERRIKKHLLPFFGNRRAAAISTDDFLKYIAMRQKAGASNGTINREFTILKRAFSIATKSTPPKILRTPHIPMLQEDNVRKGFFERHEFEAVCKFLPEAYADIANFAYITGWRSAEIKDLQFRNLDFEAGEVRLEPGTTKSREGRAFPMFSELRVLLEKRFRLAEELRKKDVRCTHVFWYERNDEILPVGRFDKAWTTACRKAGLPVTERPLRRQSGENVLYKRGPKKGKPIMTLKADAWFHDFRRTAIRNLERMGIPRSVAKLMVGHKTDSVYERYNVASKRDLDVAREKMERNGTSVFNFESSLESSFEFRSLCP